MLCRVTYALGLWKPKGNNRHNSIERPKDEVGAVRILCQHVWSRFGHD
jgi:hypothetical protein